jgi:hypothetical protein
MTARAGPRSFGRCAVIVNHHLPLWAFATRRNPNSHSMMMIRSSSSASVSDTMRRVKCGLPCAARFALPANDPTFLAAIQAAFVKRLTLSIGQQSSSPHCARLVVDNGSGNGAITNSVAGRCQQHRRQSQRHSFFHRPHPADWARPL